MTILTEVIIAETKLDKINEQFSKVILGEFQNFLAYFCFNNSDLKIIRFKIEV